MGQPVYLCIDQLPVAYNNRIVTQKRAAVVINTRKLTRAHTGATSFKGCKNLGRIWALSGLKG